MITGEAIKALLKYPIAFHRVFSEVGGGVTAGLLLSQLHHVSTHHADAEGWFYHSAKILMDETTMTRDELDGARERLRKRGLIEEARRGVPAQMHWRIDYERLANLIEEFPQTEVQKRRTKDRDEPAGKSAGTPQSLTDQETEREPDQRMVGITREKWGSYTRR
jgi:hypothetical protein